MKCFGIGRSFFYVLVAVVFWGGISPVVAEGKTKISMDVKARTDDDSSVDDYEIEADDYTKTSRVTMMFETCRLEIELKNKSDQDFTCQLEWYFISEKTPEYNANYDRAPDPVVGVFDSGKKTITLKSGGKVEEEVTSEPFMFVEDESSYVGEWERDEAIYSGDVYEGYAVFLTSSGEVLAQDSSSSRYLKEEWISKLKKYKAPRDE